MFCKGIVIRMNATAGFNGNIAVFSHIKIVVDHIVDTALGHTGGDVDSLPFGARCHMHNNAGFICFLSDLHIFSGHIIHTLSVLTQAVSPLKSMSLIIRNHFQKILCHLVYQCIQFFVSFTHDILPPKVHSNGSSCSLFSSFWPSFPDRDRGLLPFRLPESQFHLQSAGSVPDGK